MPTDSRARSGRMAEALVAWWLRACGWSIVGRRMDVAGVEVDLIATRSREVVLVEVKSRRRRGLTADLLVGREQVRRLVRAARSLAGRRMRGGALPLLVRIELAEVTWRPFPRIRRRRTTWIADADLAAGRSAE